MWPRSSTLQAHEHGQRRNTGTRRTPSTRTRTQAVDSRAHPSPRRAGTINSATHSLRSARIQSTAHTRTHTLSPGFSPTWVATVGQRSACICRQPAVAGGHITLSIAAEPEQARDKHAASSCEARADDRANLLCQAGPLRGHVRVLARICVSISDTRVLVRPSVSFFYLNPSKCGGY